MSLPSLKVVTGHMIKLKHIVFLLLIYSQAAYANVVDCLGAIDSAVNASKSLGDYPAYKSSAICSGISNNNEGLKKSVDSNALAVSFLRTIKLSPAFGDKVPQRIYNAAILDRRNEITAELVKNTSQDELLRIAMELSEFDAKYPLLCYEKKGCDGLCDASQALKYAANNLARCVSKFDFSDDCSSKFRAVKQEYQDYDYKLNEARDYCKN